MKFNKLQITSDSALDLDLTLDSPVCLLHGRYSDLALDLIRESICDYGAQNDPDRVDGCHFVIHADVELDHKNYSICYIRNADRMGENRIAVNFDAHGFLFSREDTREFLDKCRERDRDSSNVLLRSATVAACADDRPLFIYNYFDHLDEAIDVTPVLNQLASLGRQVFIAVCGSYPAEKLMHDRVQVFHI